MSKSKDAFRTISEVSEWLETPAHVLRFWESKFTQVKPVKRAGGRRYYRPADMRLLGGIKKLLHDDGLTIKGAQKLLREHGVKHVADLSQPLEDDLLEDDVVQEAAYEADAQPEPLAEEPATVLSFPNRAEPTDENVAAPDDVSAADPVQSDDDIAASGSEGDASAKQPSEAPAFGSDALPAFLRRAPAPTSAPPAPKVAAEKVTIDPVAHLEPVSEEPERNDAPRQPVFSHRSALDASELAPEASRVDAAPSDTLEETPSNASVTPAAIDVPALAKIAPDLASYTAESGVLALLPGVRRLSPEIADQLTAQLAELRSLRDRMQSH